MNHTHDLFKSFLLATFSLFLSTISTKITCKIATIDPATFLTFNNNRDALLLS